MSLTDLFCAVYTPPLFPILSLYPLIPLYHCPYSPIHTFVPNFSASLPSLDLSSLPPHSLMLSLLHAFLPLLNSQIEMLWFWKFSNFFDLNRFDQVSLSLPPFHHCIALHFLFFLSFSFSSNLQSACACARCHITAAVPLPSLSILFCFSLLSSSALPPPRSLTIFPYPPSWSNISISDRNPLHRSNHPVCLSNIS